MKQDTSDALKASSDELMTKMSELMDSQARLVDGLVGILGKRQTGNCYRERPGLYSSCIPKTWCRLP